MIANLTGKLTHKSVEYLIVDVSGIGYQLFVPLSTYYKLPDEGAAVSLNTYLNVREDALVLYGFSSIDEKNVFLKLITISGIGPRLAISILSGISVNELITAIELHDVIKLTTIPGIGKKTAQRMALELKDKIKQLELTEKGVVIITGSEETRVYDDVISALTNLGYKKPAAESALRIARGKCKEEESLETLLKMALNVFRG